MHIFDARKEDVVVVSASDNGYAMPLAVTIRSALANFAPSRRMQLYVLDGGIDESNKRRLLESWKDPRLTVQFEDAPVALFRAENNADLAADAPLSRSRRDQVRSRGVPRVGGPRHASTS